MYGAFQIFGDPILTVSSEGWLIGRNPRAMRDLPHPKCGALMRNFLIPYSRPLFDSILAGEREDGLVTLKGDGFLRRAYAFGAGEGEERQAFLIFHPLLQFLDPAAVETDNMIADSLATALATVCRDAAERGDGRSMIRYDRLRRLNTYLKPTFTGFLYERQLDDGNFRCSLRAAAVYLQNGANHIFGKCGYRLDFDPSGLPVIRLPKDEIVCFAVFLLHLMQILAELGSRPEETVRFSWQGDLVTVSVSVPLANAGFVATAMTDPSPLIRRCPSERLNYEIFRLLTERLGGSTEYDVTDAVSGTLTVRITWDTAYGVCGTNSPVLDSDVLPRDTIQCLLDCLLDLPEVI